MIWFISSLRVFVRASFNRSCSIGSSSSLSSVPVPIPVHEAWMGGVYRGCNLMLSSNLNIVQLRRPESGAK